MIKDTSLLVYMEKVLPHLMEKQEIVYRIYRKFPTMNFTNAEIAKILGVPHHHVAPRAGELRDMGLIVEVSRRVCTVTGNLAWSKRLKQ